MRFPGFGKETVGDPYDTMGAAQPRKQKDGDGAQRLVRAALARDAAAGVRQEAEARFRREHGIPESTIICGQESDPGQLGDAARAEREAAEAFRAARREARR